MILAIVNPPIDRHKPAEEVKDVYVHVTRETDAGIYVSGAKVVATSAALTHYNFMGQISKTATEDLSMSLTFIVPIDAPGLKLFCRTSYELRQKPTAVRSTTRYPRASMKTTRSSRWITFLFLGRTC